MTTDLTGTRLGEFEVVRELGRGGMGVVYEAVQTSLGRRVALKVLGPGLGLTPTAVARFRREAAAAAKLHHTNIVPVYATGEDGGVHFYAMELIDGPSLDAVIRQQRDPAADTKTVLPDALAATGPYVPDQPTPPPASGGSKPSADRFDRAAALIADVADALHHAHQSGVTHRDIKPSNLLLSADGRLSVTDFGLARMLEQPGVTVTGEFVGTPAYMSPEQITAGRIPVDHRTDIYSLGATLYELLTFRPPFRADGRDKLLALVVQKEPPSPRSIEPRVPRDLETICLKCLEKDPDRRYPTAAALADDLRRYGRRFAIQGKRAGPVAKARKWVRRNPALTAAGLAVVLAAGAAALLGWQVRAAEHRRLAEEQRRTDEAAAERRRATVERMTEAALALDLPGTAAAVSEAEAAGAPEGETELFRGWVEYMSFRPATAIPHLQRATELLPDRAGPCALLAGAYSDAGDLSTYRRVADQAAGLPAANLFDELFRGNVLQNTRSAEAISALQNATAKRRTPLGLYLLTAARLNLARISGTVEDAEAAVGAAENFRPFAHIEFEAVAMCCITRLIAATAFERMGEPGRAAEHLAAARRHAESLAHLHGDPVTLNYLFLAYVLFDGLDNKLDRTAELRAAQVTNPRNPWLVGDEAYNWLCLGNDREAEAVAGELPGHRFTSAIQTLAALGRADGRAAALRAYNKFAGTGEARLSRIEAVAVLLAIDRPRLTAMAKALALEADGQPPRGDRDWRPGLALLAGDTSEADFLAASPDGLVDRFYRHYFVGWKRLGDGDRAGARQAFEAAYRLKVFHHWDWLLTRAILIRMKDPAWPQAIPAAKK